MKRNPTPNEVENLKLGDRILVQLNGDRHETAGDVVDFDGYVERGGRLIIETSDGSTHPVVLNQVTALLPPETERGTL